MPNTNLSPANPFNSQAASTSVRCANATMLGHYAQWASHMLTLTFEDDAKGNTPNEKAIACLVRHLQAALNYATWRKRSKYNPKANILSIPVIEGMKGNKRVHVHILLGNIRDVHQVHAFIRAYIYKSWELGPKYDITEVTAVDGISWYLTKETQRINTDAVRWELALIPSTLIPKRYTLDAA
jgi:hypothetical protein